VDTTTLYRTKTAAFLFDIRAKNYLIICMNITIENNKIIVNFDEFKVTVFKAGSSTTDKTRSRVQRRQHSGGQLIKEL